MKKIVSIVLVAMMLCCLAVPAMAEVAYTATISNSNAYAGSSVTVKVTLSQEIEGIGSGAAEVSVPSGLTLTAAEWLIDGASLTDFDVETKRGVFAFDSVESISGDVLSLTFAVDAGAAVEDTFKVSATLKVVDGSRNETNVDVADGTIIVECQHNFNTGWTTDETYHWHKCGNNCGDIADKAEHVYTNACDKTCNVCGFKRTTNHEFSEEWVIEETDHYKYCTKCGVKTQVGSHMGTVLTGAVAADCDDDGYTGDYYCVCGKLMTKGSSIPATGHHYVDGKCVDCGLDENPQTGDALALLIAVAVVSMGAAALTFKKRK